MSRAMLLAGCDRLRQFGAVVTLAALDLGELGWRMFAGTATSIIFGSGRRRLAISAA
jgi:hypothetical protein